MQRRRAAQRAVAVIAQVASAMLLVPTLVAAPQDSASGRPEAAARRLEELSFEELLDLEVITSSRTTPVRYSTAPATMIVITSEQIRNRNYQSLLEVLLDLPNVKVDTLNDPRWMSDVSIRGIWGMDKFIIMVDGVRVSSPTNDTIPIMDNYPIHFAKQIEIVYGPASALYGADAFSGVINIIPKRAAELEAPGEASVAGGMYGTYSGSILVGSEIGERAQYTIAGRYTWDSQPELSRFYPDEFAGINEALRSGVFDTDFGQMIPTTPVRPEAETPLEAYAVHATLSLDDFELALFSNFSRNPTSIANKPNNNVYNRDVYFARTINVLSGRYSRTIGKVTAVTDLIGSWHRLDPHSKWRNVYTAMEPSYQFSYGRMIKAEQLLSASLGDSLRITGGVTYEDYLAIPDSHDLARPVGDRRELHGTIVNSDIYPNNPNGIPARFFTLRYANAGALFEAAYKASDAISLTVGVRFDDNSRFGSTTNPRLGLVWSPSSKTTVKALHGRAFLAPSPYAAYKEFGSFVSFDDGLTFRSFFMRLSNPDLEPQRNRTSELSLHYLARDDLSLSLRVFHSDLSGLFTQVNDADFGDRYGGVYPVEGHHWPIDYVETVINLGRQTNYGGTVQLDAQRTLGTSGKLALYLALSYVDGRVDLDGDAPSGTVEIGGISPWSCKLGGEIVLDRLTVSPRLILIDRQRTHPLQSAAFTADDPSDRQTIDGYALLNLDLQYRLSRRASVFVKATNLLDQRYRTVNLGAAPEGLAQGSAAVEFERGAPQNPVRALAGLRVSF